MPPPEPMPLRKVGVFTDPEPGQIGPALLEYYETPHPFIRAQHDDLRQRVPELFRPPEPPVLPWCAPCVGRGAIPETWDPNSAHWETNDLDPRWSAEHHLNAADPKAWTAFRLARTVVENPPFSVASAVLQRSLEYAEDAVCLHLRFSFFEVTKEDPRAKLLRACPPRGLLFLPRFAFRRSPSTGKWTTDSVATVWATWLQSPAYDHIEPWITFADQATLDALAEETPNYRQRIDRIVGIPTPAAL